MFQFRRRDIGHLARVTSCYEADDRNFHSYWRLHDYIRMSTIVAGPSPLYFSPVRSRRSDASQHLQIYLNRQLPALLSYCQHHRCNVCCVVCLTGPDRSWNVIL